MFCIIFVRQATFMLKSRSFFIASFVLFTIISCQNKDQEYNHWPVYNGSAKGLKYSSMIQIDTTNVHLLKPVWTYHSGDVDTAAHSQIQCNPIVVEGILYGVNPNMKLFAVDAYSGKELWTFSPLNDLEFSDNSKVQHNMINSRGVSYWTDGKGDERIFFTGGSNTYAVEAKTGLPIKSFGKGGYIDLHDDFERDMSKEFIVNTSPAMIYKDLVIMGSRVNETIPAAPGHIRAWDAKTGKLVWTFHTIPKPGEEGYESWDNPDAWKTAGGVNCWAGFSLDEKTGMLFVPLGSASYDFYGGNRKGANLFANSLVALDAATGKYIWHFQTIHHDVWDKDLPTPPAIVSLTIGGKKVDAVVQTTKNGFIYVLDKLTGKPLYEVNEMAVIDKSELAGEALWPTQPVASKPVPFSRQQLDKDDLNPYVSEASQAIIREQMANFRTSNMFEPPGITESLIFPGFDGGGEWGGPAVDPETGMLYVNANNMAWIMKIKEIPKPTSKKENWFAAGQRLYETNCASCHGNDMKGRGNNADISKVNERLTKVDFVSLLISGRRMMPAFSNLTDEEKNAITTFVMDVKEDKNRPYSKAFDPDTTYYLPFRMESYQKFLTPEGYPAISPPWGTISAIDLNTGEMKWQNVFGEYPELTAKGIAPTGAENYGGPVVTAGGLVFIAANKDGKMRAYNKISGKLLWEYELPAPGFATPAVYTLKGKQFVVIAAGGGKLNTNSSDAYIAFALDDNK